ncbi:MAG TPA: ADP-ribosylglycohydrolase family protein [Ferruginibacter sp.]|nr:ADP-ribosylglycohydrolase family protein [Ferruginibacter sp.]HRO06017.1 ADP-ribosylglycohydrolase family protein [Ferruginibacter sp.]HRO97037.1 ADP-ribosylglycohydrolase family protein [Ferruginibacter sp.]HRP49900.1 ADP-ribosylglycohydrolase family protein [Ferruginibacter sp.]
MNRDFYKDILFGLSIGDALGVPFEFKDRAQLIANPAADMEGYGTYQQPPGTFSDDSSMAFCLAEALTQGFNLSILAQHFVSWLRNRYWTAHDEVFDVGIATSRAIRQLEMRVPPEFAGGNEESDNGNGSLMRILPLVLHIKDFPEKERFAFTQAVSSITHRHYISVVACFYYLEFARLIIQGEDKMKAYKKIQSSFRNSLQQHLNPLPDLQMFNRLLEQDIFKLTSDQIFSSGYVVYTLEASIWCLLTTNSYKEATLKAVNLGFDTDTTASVTGGLAALVYGWKSIPRHWLQQLARYDDIESLAERLRAACENK